MNHVCIVSGMLLAFVIQGAVAQEEKKPAAEASAQGAGQGQADIQADQSGATASGQAAGSAGAAAGESSAALAQGTEINATLTRPVDAGKAQPGDEVTATASKDLKSGGAVVVPRGSRLFGHVTSARPRGSGAASGDSASELGILFDRAVLKDGSVVTLNGAVAAIGSARAAGGNSLDSGAAGAHSTTGSAGGAGGGLAGTVGGTVGGVAGATTGVAGNVGAAAGGAAGAMVRSVGAVGGFDATGAFKSGSRGVFGVRDLNIAAAATGGAGGSVITSAQRNVRLESGTQMLLVAGASAGKQPTANPDAPMEKPADKR